LTNFMVNRANRQHLARSRAARPGRGGRTIDFRIVLVALSFALAGCGDDDEKPAPLPSDAPDPRVGAAEFEAVRASFGVLETLAGSGLKGGDTNDWDPGFEGGPATAADLSTPHNALGDALGNTFIADKDAHAIRKVSPDGVISTVAGVNTPGDDGDAAAPAASAHLRQPNGIWIASDGSVYILDLGNEKVRKIGLDGSLTTLFAVPDLVAGRGLWVADDESLAYVGSGTRVVRWTPESGAVTYASGFVELGNLFVDSAGTLFVTDRGSGRVLRLDEGHARPIAGNGSTEPVSDGALALETGLNEVRGIWRAANGGFFLGTHGNNQVLYLDSVGFLHVLIDGAHDAHAGDGEPLSTPGAKISEVRNVVLNPAGDLLVTENDVGYIRVARRAR
jgi:hypothetical protein